MNLRFRWLLLISIILFSFAYFGLNARGQSNHARKQPPPNSGGMIDEQNNKQNKQDKDKAEISLNSDLVTVIAAVTGKDGDFVSDLKKEDFEILEDNVPQTISGFSREDAVPLELAFLFDTSGSVRERRDFEKKAAVNFFKDVFRQQDRAAIYTVNTEVSTELPFTNRLDNIINTVNRINIERGATALYDAIYLSSNDLEKTQGRHVMMILSDGRDNVSTYDLKKALARAQDADVVIYAVHPYGRDVSANLRDPGAEQALITFAEETGGDAYFSANVDELDRNFRRFAAELHAQYILTFYSKNEAHDGTFRRLTLKVKRPGLTVRTRKGYYAPK
ncbi:MAG TPA: VWA domain-containing protein [Blastocatellia bacterium]|nr:VWA domain-containing protein [Blastocatellia bacterium]